MIAHLLEHPILLLTHIIAAILGYFVHYYLVCRQRHEVEEPLVFDIKQVTSVGINVVILVLFIGATVDAQYYEGPQPGLIFTLMASWAFGSLAAERAFFSEIIEVLVRRGNKK